MLPPEDECANLPSLQIDDQARYSLKYEYTTQAYIGKRCRSYQFIFKVANFDGSV